MANSCLRRERRQGTTVVFEKCEPLLEIDATQTLPWLLGFSAGEAPQDIPAYVA